MNANLPSGRMLIGRAAEVLVLTGVGVLAGWWWAQKTGEEIWIAAGGALGAFAGLFRLVAWALRNGSR